MNWRIWAFDSLRVEESTHYTHKHTRLLVLLLVFWLLFTVDVRCLMKVAGWERWAEFQTTNILNSHSGRAYIYCKQYRFIVDVWEMIILRCCFTLFVVLKRKPIVVYCHWLLFKREKITIWLFVIEPIWSERLKWLAEPMQNIFFGNDTPRPDTRHRCQKQTMLSRIQRYSLLVYSLAEWMIGRVSTRLLDDWLLVRVQYELNMAVSHVWCCLKNDSFETTKHKQQQSTKESGFLYY